MCHTGRAKLGLSPIDLNEHFMDEAKLRNQAWLLLELRKTPSRKFRVDGTKNTMAPVAMMVACCLEEFVWLLGSRSDDTAGSA